MSIGLSWGHECFECTLKNETFVENVIRLFEENPRLGLLTPPVPLHEDHLGRAYAGIEGYRREDQVRTFTKSELTELLETSGFGKLSWFYPFPDYKLPTLILSEESIRTADLDFPEISNYDLKDLRMFSQREAFAGLKGTAERELFANSFLVSAERSSG